MRKSKKKIVEEMHEHGIICMDVPFLIRLLEYSRESVESDVDVHFVAARAIKESEDGKVLTMHDYSKICL